MRIFGELYKLRCEVGVVTGLSAHAGQDLLVKYAAAMQGRVKDIYLVHGEEDAANALMNKLQEHGITNVHYPELTQVVEV